MPPAKKSRTPSPAEAADAVRSAVDQTFQATLGARGRAQELVDDLATAANRFRDALDDVRLATGDDVKDLRRQMRALEKRIAALEGKKAPAKKASAKKTPAKKA